MTERRRYALTKIRPGDYLVPANDGETLYRLSTYTEDGSVEGLVGTFWGVWRYKGRRPLDALGLEDLEDWNEWEMVEMLLRTRRQALETLFAPG